MYDMHTRKRALALLDAGHSLDAAGRLTGVSRSTLRQWRVRIEPAFPRPTCPRCQDPPELPQPAGEYAYLLGLYLGDGCVSAQPNGGWALRIACADSWPGLIDACADAIHAIRPENRVCRVRGRGCTMVTCYSKHWPCLLPQTGPGPKHNRRITLAPWQRDIVDAHLWPFVRGLVHSDGCRITNWTERQVGGRRKRYEYPRYFFSNTSDDIRALYTDALDRLGVEWKQSNAKDISVARRASVALMDRHVGPKF